MQYEFAKILANGLCHETGTSFFLICTLKFPNKVCMNCSSYRPNIMMQILHGFIQKQAMTSSVHIHSFINHLSSYLLVLYKVG